jgi:hypothetical protein
LMPWYLSVGCGASVDFTTLWLEQTSLRLNKNDFRT